MPQDGDGDVGAPIALWARRGAWLGPAGTLALLVIGVVAILAALPEAIRLVNAGAALAGWSLAHWGCPQPVEANPVVACGLSRGLLPAP
jgi:hypothetical protein